MKSCTTCAAELDQNYEICPFCLTVLIPEKHPKRKIKFEKLKVFKISFSYLVFIAFTVSYALISESCYKSGNIQCYNLSYIFMILCVCTCCIANYILGKDTDLKTAESLMAPEKEKKTKIKSFIYLLLFFIIFIVIYVLTTSRTLFDVIPLS